MPSVTRSDESVPRLQPGAPTQRRRTSRARRRSGGEPAGRADAAEANQPGAPTQRKRSAAGPAVRAAAEATTVAVYAVVDMLLAFDTATHAVTTALHDGSAVLTSATVVDPLRHGELLAPGIARVLADAGATPRDLTRIAVGVGPGPFTGLRVGIVTALTMGAVLDIPVVGVCTLDILAAAVTEAGPFVVATDARRKEVYWAGYDAATSRVSTPAVGSPDLAATPLPVAGRGPALYPDAFPRGIDPQNPDAAVLATLVIDGRAVTVPPEPLYLRRPEVSRPKPRKRQT